jgi:hypothetical protein
MKRPGAQAPLIPCQRGRISGPLRGSASLCGEDGAILRDPPGARRAAPAPRARPVGNRQHAQPWLLRPDVPGDRELPREGGSPRQRLDVHDAAVRRGHVRCRRLRRLGERERLVALCGDRDRCRCRGGNRGRQAMPAAPPAGFRGRRCWDPHSRRRDLGSGRQGRHAAGCGAGCDSVVAGVRHVAAGGCGRGLRQSLDDRRTPRSPGP